MDSPDRRARRADATSSARSSPPTCATAAIATIVTRFPPEPNGYLHIGHAKSICLNFGIAAEFGGRCHLRFDDTNPVKEEQEYIDAIQADVRWLGFDWGEHLYHASDYFEQLYDWAVHLIRHGQCLRRRPVRRRDPRRPAARSPSRAPTARGATVRSTRASTCSPGCARASSRTAPASCARGSTWPSPNINLRDPVLYRIVHATHPRTGDAWCIYPTYDFAHGQSDAIEGVTHSLCTLEFENHRPLYDWLHRPPAGARRRPRQIEFARLNLTYTVLSKRFLLRLVNEGHVRGWDDPRMPTISGLRRRGFPAEGIRDFAAMVGVAKTDSVIEVGQLEYAVRSVLNRTAQRRFGVLDPLKVVIENYPEGQVEQVEVPNNPEDPAAGTRRGRLLARAVDRARGLPGGAAARSSSAWRRAARSGCGRAYFVTCTEVVKDDGRAHRRAALHLRPGDARRRRARRPAAQGDPPLGVGRDGRPGRGAPVRPPLHRAPIPGADGDLVADLEPGLGDDRPRSACWSRPLADAPGRRDRPVRAPGLLHAGPGQPPGRPRLRTGR